MKSLSQPILRDLESRILDALRFPLAVMVVVIHSSISKDYHLPDYTALSGTDICVALQILFSHVVCHVSVPVFFMMSGYFFFYKAEKFDVTTYLSKLKSRIYTLLIPYILWNTLYIFYIVLRKLAGVIIKGKPLEGILEYFSQHQWLHMYWDCNVWALDRMNWLGYNTPLNGPILVPMWFLRDLMVIVVLTPILYPLLRRFGKLTLTLLAIFYITRIWPVLPGSFPTAAFFFAFGAYFSIHREVMVDKLYRIRIPVYLICIPLLILTFLWDGTHTRIGQYIYPFFIIAGVISVICLATNLVPKGYLNFCNRLSPTTFFIYAGHAVFGLYITYFILKRIIPQSNLDENWLLITLKYLLTPVMATSICLVVYVVLERWSPKLLSLLIGNRRR